MENDTSRELDEEKRGILLSRIEGWLKESRLLYDFMRPHGFRVPFGDEKKPVYVFVLVADSFLVLIANNGLRVDMSQPSRLLEAINKWNTERPLGNFELHGDGLVNYRYGIDDPGSLDSAGLRQRIFHCASAMEARLKFLDNLTPSMASA